MQTAIPDAIRLIVPDLDVGWRTREARYRADRHVLLTLTSRPRLGVDERRYSDPDESGAMTERVYGNRRVTVTVQVETQDQDLAESAHDLAETIRTGIRRSDVESVLSAAGLGGARTTEPRAADYRDKEGRWRSAVVFELHLLTHASHAGPAIPAVAAVEWSGETPECEPIAGPRTAGG